jgi:hypothetical protein
VTGLRIFGAIGGFEIAPNIGVPTISIVKLLA